MTFRPHRPVSTSWILGALTLSMTGLQPAHGIVTTYLFNNNLSAQESGAPALTAVDPQATSGFQTDTVFGQSRTVYNFIGNTTPAQQAGLSLDTTGRIPANNYSVEMV